MARRGHWGKGAVLGGALLAACSVDTSDITFIRDDAFDVGGLSSGGKVGSGGVLNGGALNKAGAGGKAGSGSGGATNGGSKLTAGSDPGGSGPGGGSGGSGPNGGMNTGGMPPESCPTVSAEPSQPLLDNLDDGDPGLPMIAGRIGGWYAVGDMSGGTLLPVVGPTMPPNPAMPGALGTPFAMRMSGGGFTEWGASLGVNLLLPIPGRAPCPYDLSRHAGMRFMLKGTVSDMIVRFQVATVETHQPGQGGTCEAPAACGDHYGADVPISPEWAEVKVDFADLSQAGWGDEFAFELRHAINIEFRVRENTTFDVWVDDLTFY